MEDWEPVKVRAQKAYEQRDCRECMEHAGVLLLAVAEIEQLREWYQSQICLTELLGEENNLLRQDKAELEKQLNKILDSWD